MSEDARSHRRRGHNVLLVLPAPLLAGETQHCVKSSFISIKRPGSADRKYICFPVDFSRFPPPSFGSTAAANIDDSRRIFCRSAFRVFFFCGSVFNSWAVCLFLRSLNHKPVHFPPSASLRSNSFLINGAKLAGNI